MSTPMSSGGMDDVDQSSSKKPVSFQFCAECSNMLYPREDNSSRTLQFVCRTCHYTTEAINTCVFRNELSSTASLHAGIIPGMGKDPTVGAALAAPINESADGSASASVALNAAGPSFPLTHSRPPSPPASDYSGSSPATTVLLCTGCGLPVLCEVCGIAHIYVPTTSPQETQSGTAPASPAPSPPFGPSANDGNNNNGALDFGDLSLFEDDMMYDFMGEDAEDGDDEAQQTARD